MEKTRVDLLSVRMSSSSQKSKDVTSAEVSQLPRHGSPTCQCMGLENLTGMIDMQVMGVNVKYPSDLGSTCHAWDAGRHPACNAKASVKPSWCSRPWCYVDPCTCTGVSSLPMPDTQYLPNGRVRGVRLYKSYATCNPTASHFDETNTLAATIKDTLADCAAPTDSRVIGNDDCMCVGIQGLPGLLNRTWKGITHQYPAETGSYCKSWDAYHFGECVGLSAPSYCQKQWCFVDPCNCRNIRASPEPSGFNGLWRGRPLYTSYETCGDDVSDGAVGNFQAPAMCR